MLAFMLATIVAATPTPSGTKDVVTAVWYAPSPYLPASTIDLCGSASTSIYFSTWQLSDTRVSSALAAASSRSVPVRVALNLTGGTGTLQHQLARQLVSSGGTVWNCSIPRQIENNFVVANENYSINGNYYYSQTAVQPGSYSQAISGTGAATAFVTRFNELISGGTLVTAEVSRTRDTQTAVNNDQRPLFLAPLIELLGDRTSDRAVRQCQKECRQNDDGPSTVQMPGCATHRAERSMRDGRRRRWFRRTASTAEALRAACPRRAACVRR